MFIHDSFDIIIQYGVSEINSTRINFKKGFLHQNELIIDQNDYNVNKFSSCIVCIGTTSKIKI